MPSPLDHILNSPSLPSLPSVAVKLLDLSRDPSASTRDFVQTTQSDPAISAKILKLSNSSFFGIRTEITTIQRAIGMLGTRAVTSLALSFSIARQSVGDNDTSNHFREYWQRSVLQAVACEAMVDFQKEHSTSELFLAGLMLDIGRLAMLKVLGRKYVTLLNKISADSPMLIQLEHEEFGFDHTQAGSGLLTQWGFPPTLVAAVGRHHGLGPVEDAEKEVSETLKLTRVAAALCDYFYDQATGRAMEAYLQVANEMLGLDKASALDLADEVADHFRESADMFDADAYDLPDPMDLMAAANQQLAVMNVEAEKFQANLEDEVEALRHRAIHDPLTGAYNRTYFDATLGEEADLARRNARSIGVIFLDVDKFKNLNDTFGHQFGDEVLKALAEQFRGVLRESDVLARFGGEEFVVLARQPTLDGLRVLSERLRAVAEKTSFVCEAQPVPVTVSVGAAYLRPTACDVDIDNRLIKEADAAMYDSKHNGRNQYHVRCISDAGEVTLANETERRRFSARLVEQGLLTSDQVMTLDDDMTPVGKRLGALAVRLDMLEAWQVDALIEEQRANHSRERFGQLAVARGWLKESQLAGLLAVQAEDPDVTARLVIERGLLPPDIVTAALEMFWSLTFIEPLQPVTSDL